MCRSSVPAYGSKDGPHIPPSVALAGFSVQRTGVDRTTEASTTNWLSQLHQNTAVRHELDFEASQHKCS
jgi:hypothetical protein